VNKLISIYSKWESHEDVNELLLRQIQHFFEHYKDLEAGKWVKIGGWEGPDAARAEISAGAANYSKAQA
jgi:inorganic pyrophosphatase